MPSGQDDGEGEQEERLHMELHPDAALIPPSSAGVQFFFFGTDEYAVEGFADDPNADSKDERILISPPMKEDDTVKFIQKRSSPVSTMGLGLDGMGRTVEIGVVSGGVQPCR